LQEVQEALLLLGVPLISLFTQNLSQKAQFALGHSVRPPTPLCAIFASAQNSQLSSSNFQLLSFCFFSPRQQLSLVTVSNLNNNHLQQHLLSILNRNHASQGQSKAPSSPSVHIPHPPSYALVFCFLYLFSVPCHPSSAVTLNLSEQLFDISAVIGFSESHPSLLLTCSFLAQPCLHFIFYFSFVKANMSPTDHHRSPWRRLGHWSHLWPGPSSWSH